MMEEVAAMGRIYGDKLKYREYKIKEKEGVVAMMKLGVSNLPTIVVDGVIRFISIIPDRSPACSSSGS